MKRVTRSLNEDTTTSVSEVDENSLGEGCQIVMKRKESGSLNYHTTSLEVEITFQSSVQNVENGNAQSFGASVLLGNEFEQIYAEQYTRLIALVGKG